MNLAEKGSWIGDWLAHLKTTPDGNYYFAFAAGTFHPTNVDDDVQSLERGKWIHVAMTWDGTRRKLYIDGKLDGEDTPTGRLSPNGSPIEIGGRSGPSVMFVGEMDEFKLFSPLRPESQELAYGKLVVTAIHWLRWRAAVRTR